MAGGETHDSVDPMTDPLGETAASAGVDPLEASRMRSAVKTALFGDAPPARVGRYRLLDKLGEGGMGVVYKAHDDELDRDVAIKLLRPGGGGTAKRLLREARSMARLAHPNIAAIYDVGTHGEAVYIAMEYVTGPSLRRWFSAPRTFSETRAVMLGAAQGLVAAHEAGVVHRDFKPDNVIVGSDGRVRVLDFGLAKLPASELGRTSEAALTDAATTLGTPRYMAPEQLRQQPAGPAADQFAFSVSMYEATFGSLPFPGEVFAEVVASVLAGSPTTPDPTPDVPEALWPILKRGMAREPADRFASMRAMAEALTTLGLASPPPVLSSPAAMHDARDGAREQLGAAFAHSLITTDELDARLERLENAHSPATVRGVIADLPASSEPVAGAALVPATPAALPVTANPNLPAVLEPPAAAQVNAVFSSAKRNGGWEVARSNAVLALFGSVDLDFRDVALPSGETTVALKVIFGSVDIIVPPGTRVRADCSSFFGSVDQDDPSLEIPPDAPILRITGAIVMGSREIHEREIGEGFFGAWRRRRAAKKARQLASRAARRELPPGKR